MFDGQADVEAGSSLRSIKDINCSLMLMGNDEIRNRQAETGADSDRFGSKERFEDPRPRIGSDAGAIILDINNHN